MTEHTLQNEILRAYGTQPDLRLWRANCGMGVVGDVSRILSFCRRLKIPARTVSFGVPGQADLTGILGDGRRLEVEVKASSGRQTTEQQNYERMIVSKGGIYVLARSVDDVRAAIGG